MYLVNESILNTTILTYAMSFHNFRNKMLKIGLLGSQFSNLSLPQIRIFFQNHCQSYEQLVLLFEILNTQLQTPEQILKSMCTIHILLQDISTSTFPQIIQFLCGQIKNLLQIANQLLLRQKCLPSHEPNPERRKSKSLFSGIFNQFSKKKLDVVEKEKAKCPPLRLITSSQMENEGRDKLPEVGQENQVNKESLFYKNIAIPYANYLLKLTKIQENKTIRNEEESIIFLWANINSLRNLFTITQNFASCLRYYESYFIDPIMFMVKIFDQQIQHELPPLNYFLSEKIQTLRKQFQTLISEKELPSETRRVLLLGLKAKHSLCQLKQLFQEVARLNDSIMVMYQGRMISSHIQKQKLKTPSLIPNYLHEIETIYHIIEEAQKQQKKSEIKRIKRSITLGQKLATQKLAYQEPLSALKKNKIAKQYGKNKVPICPQDDL